VTVKEFQPAAKRGPVSEHKYDWTLERKTVLTETGFAPQAIRTGLILPAALQQPRIADLIPQGTTDQTAIVYMEETTTTNAVAGTLEGNLKPEAALAFTERNSPVRKIAGILPVTDELLNDIPALRSYIEMRLRLFLALAEDRDLYAGAGSPTLTGLINISGIQTQARSTDPGPDAFFKAMVKVYTGAFLQASGIVMHPIDWQNIPILPTRPGYLHLRQTWRPRSRAPMGAERRADDGGNAGHGAGGGLRYRRPDIPPRPGELRHLYRTQRLLRPKRNAAADRGKISACLLSSCGLGDCHRPVGVTRIVAGTATDRCIGICRAVAIPATVRSQRSSYGPSATRRYVRLQI